MWKFWLIIAGLCFVIESFTVGFFVFWFGIGALIALASSLFIKNLFIQSIIFIISSSLLLVLTKPLVNKFIKTPQTKLTNVYGLVNKEGIVLENIDSLNATGKVKVNGEIWSAISNEKIEKDCKIKVLSIKGVKLEVEKISDLTKVD